MNTTEESKNSRYARERGMRGGLLWPELRDAMQAGGYTEASLARKLTDMGVKRVSERTVDAWLRRQRNPTTAKVKALAVALECETSRLIPS